MILHFSVCNQFSFNKLYIHFHVHLLKERILSDFIPYCTGHVITYPCRVQSLAMIVQGAIGSIAAIATLRYDVDKSHWLLVLRFNVFRLIHHFFRRKCWPYQSQSCTWLSHFKSITNIRHSCGDDIGVYFSHSIKRYVNHSSGIVFRIIHSSRTAAYIIMSQHMFSVLI